jgi:hypothetical protein
VHGIVERDPKTNGNEMPLDYPSGAMERPLSTGERSGFEPLSDTFADRTAEWLDRIEAMIERYPWPTLLLALGVGYVIARRMR